MRWKGLLHVVGRPPRTAGQVLISKGQCRCQTHQMSSAYSRMVLSDENLPLPAVYMMDLHNKRNGTSQTPEVSAWAPECVAECAFPSSDPCYQNRVFHPMPSTPLPCLAPSQLPKTSHTH